MVMPPDPRQVGVLQARQVIEATEQAMGRAAVAVHEDLKQGLNTLATLTCVAPLVGVFGTVYGIMFDTFLGVGTEKTTAMANIAERLSTACLPTALGLLVALQSLWCYRYFQGKLTQFDHEIESDSLRLVSQLQLHLQRLGPAALADSISQSLPFLEQYSADAGADRKRWRRSAVPSTVLLVIAWGIELACYLDFDSVPLGTAMLTAFRSVLVIFCCACLPAYAVWVDLMHRKTTNLALPAAALCLSWCIAGLVFPALRFQCRQG